MIIGISPDQKEIDLFGSIDKKLEAALRSQYTDTSVLAVRHKWRCAALNSPQNGGLLGKQTLRQLEKNANRMNTRAFKEIVTQVQGGSIKLERWE